MIRTVSPQEYLAVPRPQLEWLVTGLIPKPAYLLLLGQPKAGKSFLAWDIATCVATGTSLMGYSCPSPQKVLYIQLDTKEHAWTERLKTFADAGVNLNIPNLRLVHQDDMLLPLIITTDKGKHWVQDVLAQEDPALVIMDVLRELHNEDENDSTVMKKVFDAMEPLFAGRTVLLVHHTRKSGEADKQSPDPVALARGSSYITGRVDGYWLLYGDAPLRKLRWESRFQEATTTTAKQDPNTGLFSFPDLVPDASLIASLTALCAKNPTKTHAQLWREASTAYGISRSTYYRLIAGLACVHRAPAGTLVSPPAAAPTFP